MQRPGTVRGRRTSAGTSDRNKKKKKRRNCEGVFPCAPGIITRRANLVKKGWDEETRDALRQRMVSETLALYNGMIRSVGFGAWVAWSWTCGSMPVLWRSVWLRRDTKLCWRMVTGCDQRTTPTPLIGALNVDKLDADQIMSLHRNSEHPGVQRAIYFISRVCLPITKAAVRSAIWACEECQLIDSAPIHLGKGKLEVNGNWQRLWMDITHYSAHHFFDTECGPSRFSIWKQLARQDSATVIRQLEAVFIERGPLQELLTDNYPAFCSREFRALARSWSVNLQFRCVYTPDENAITVLPPHGETNCGQDVLSYPGSRLVAQCYTQRQWNTPDCAHWQDPTTRIKGKGVYASMTSPDPEYGFYQIGDCVCVKAPQSRNTTKFDRSQVMKIISPQSFLVNRIPHPMKDLRSRLSLTASEEDSDDTSESRESAAWRGKCGVWRSIRREGRSKAPPPVFVMKHSSKTSATRLPPLWSWDQEWV